MIRRRHKLLQLKDKFEHSKFQWVWTCLSLLNGGGRVVKISNIKPMAELIVAKLSNIPESVYIVSVSSKKL